MRSNDGGATPRTMGECEAIDGGHEVIAYLDANGILEPNFVAKVLRALDTGFDCVCVPAPRVTTSNETPSLKDGSAAVNWIPTCSMTDLVTSASSGPADWL